MGAFTELPDDERDGFIPIIMSRMEDYSSSVVTQKFNAEQPQIFRLTTPRLKSTPGAPFAQDDTQLLWRVFQDDTQFLCCVFLLKTLEKSPTDRSDFVFT
jgi:hypothetical protein